jgi:hypothetical protein
MAYTPVIIVVFSLFFLVSMLSFHTLRRYKQEVLENFDRLLQKSIFLYDTLLEMLQVVQKNNDTINNDLIILNLTSVLKNEKTSLLEKIKAEKQLSEELAVFLASIPKDNFEENSHLQVLKQRLSQQNTLLATEKYKFMHSMKSYNGFVQTLPSSWVAKVYGFRKM